MSGTRRGREESRSCSKGVKGESTIFGGNNDDGEEEEEVEEEEEEEVEEEEEGRAGMGMQGGDHRRGEG